MGARNSLAFFLAVFFILQCFPITELSEFKEDYNSPTDGDLTPGQIDSLNELSESLNTAGRSTNFAQASWDNVVTFGGIHNDHAYDAKLGPWGTVYVTGTFETSMTLGSTTLTTPSTNSHNQIFVARLNASGTWDWAIQAGGEYYNDRGHSIVVANDGSAYVHGIFYGAANPVFGSISPASTENIESFVGKVSNAGVWDWVTPIHGSSYQYSGQITIDSNGDVIVCGLTFASITLGSFTTGGSGLEFYLAKLSASNGAVTNAIEIIEHSWTSYSTVCDIDSNDNVYIASEFKTSSGTSVKVNVPGIGTFTSDDQLDILIVKVDSSFSILWAEQIGSSGNDFVRDIYADNNSDIYITGSVPTTTNFGSNQITASDETGYIAKMSSTRTWLWAEALGSSGKSGDIVNSIDVFGDRFVVAGNLNDGAQFGSQTYSSPSTTTPGMFLAQYYTNGTPIWIDGYGGNEPNEKFNNIDINDQGNILVAGSVDDYALAFGSSNTQTPNLIDAFLGIMVDVDRDGILNDNDDCSFGKIGWISSSVNDYDSDGCEDASEDQDDDNDGLEDSQDNCDSPLNWESNSITDYDSDGCDDSSEDTDDDNDGVDDVDDNCQTGLLSWQSDSSSDYDSDGCKDVEEDSDDDNDGILDDSDNCSKGTLNWISDSTTDTDSDGCRDIDEDDDDDADGVSDGIDNCITGVTNWISNSTNDYDSDGCRDLDEDDDDDSDNIIDLNDNCQTGKLGWASTGSNDYDSDGCFDEEEDDDDDNDNVTDTFDSCAKGDLNWISDQSTDYDSDGCKDIDEDNDDDNDSVYDILDNCPAGTLGWTSSSSSDYDSDGCQDSGEDIDDDNDGILDQSDSCLTGVTGWTSGEVLDRDGDGCRDLDEDSDDDNDGIGDSSDQCSSGDTNWTSNSSLDYDMDGCRDSDEDSDDDNDGIVDLEDSCQLGQNDWTSDSMNDHDSDGCRDNSEDLDDDNDGVEDTSDNCQTGSLGWTSNKTLDYDLDGCKDSDEDEDDDDDRVLDSADECKESALEWDSNDNTDLNRNGCPDELEENDPTADENATSNNKDASTEDLSFVDRLTEGDLDAIGIVIAIILPIVGLSISVMLKKRKIKLVNSITLRINRAVSSEELNQINIEIDAIIASDKISQVQYQSLKNSIESKQIDFSPVVAGNAVSSNSVESNYNSEIGEQSVTMQDSVIGGDSFVGSTNIESQVYNDPTAIARAAVEAYRMGAEANNQSGKKENFAAQRVDGNGYEWYSSEDGSQFYRLAGSSDNWTKFE